MLTELTPSQPVEVFVSYAHEDEELRRRLAKHLAILEREGLIQPWHGRQITPGTPWERVIDKHINSAQIILLLVSTDFLASDYCYGVEFRRAMERHETEAAEIIPIILRPCRWRETPIGMFQALPDGGEPVVRWADRDEAFLNVEEGIRKAVMELSPRDRPKRLEEVSVTLEGLGPISAIKIKRQFQDRGVDLSRITISIIQGSIKIVIKGDSEELSRIVVALRDPNFQRELTQGNTPKAITYLKSGQLHVIPIANRSRTLIEILRDAMRDVPGFKYALVIGVMAALVTIVAGFRIDYKVAVLGSIIMCALMFGLILFSSIVTNPAASRRPLALSMSWIFVALTTATSLSIFTSFFFSWPRPLEAYVHFPSPSPTVSALPTPLPSPSPNPTPQRVQITINEVPPYDPVGGPASRARIAGKVSGVRQEDYSVVIYSFTKLWYVQPRTDHPNTQFDSDGNWSAEIQTGTRYAALVVPRHHTPPFTTTISPTQLDGVVASTEVEGKRVR